MHEIQMHEMSKAFFPCWKAAANHLDNHMDGDFASWLRAHPYPPFLEHLSFRLGNQLFFVQVEDVDGKVMGPGNPIGCVAAARNADGHACILPMKRSALDGTWAPDLPGWSLVDAENGKPIDPLGLVTEQKIEMTPWELHDMAVQIVRGYMERRGFEMISWQSNPEFDPSIWFVGTDKQPEWVVVRATRFPAKSASRPRNWQAIAESCAGTGTKGHFASVAMVSTNQPFESDDEPPTPLWRGYGMHVRFTGLE
jgi:hypothetical protein